MEEKILVYIDPANDVAIIEWLARWMTVSALGPRTYALASVNVAGYLSFDEAMRVATITLEAIDCPTELESLAHVMWFLSLADDLVQHGAALAIIIGAKDDIDSANITEQARHAAAWYPETLLGDERQLYFKVGSFRISPYASHHLTTFMTPPAAAGRADREAVMAMNAFMERQREEDARLSARAASVAREAMRRVREAPETEIEPK